MSFNPNLGLPSCLCLSLSLFFVALFPIVHIPVFFFFITPYGSLSLSNTSVVNLINVLKDGHIKPGRHSELEPEQSPVQSSRIVLLARNQPRSPRTISGGWLNGTCMSLSDDTRVTPESPLLSEKRGSPLNDYTGCKPLIGKHKLHAKSWWYLFSESSLTLKGSGSKPTACNPRYHCS